MNYRHLIEQSLRRFCQAMEAERWVASESEYVNFFEKRGLIPVVLEEDSRFDLARICRESHVRNPYHTPGAPRGATTHRRKADLAIWPATQLTTYGDSLTDPAFAPDVLMEFKVDVGESSKRSGLQRGHEEDREKVRLACEQSPGLLGCVVWIDVPNNATEHEFFQHK